jgi:hypothetical protein
MQIGADVRIIARAIGDDILAEVVRKGSPIAGRQFHFLAGKGVVKSFHTFISACQTHNAEKAGNDSNNNNIFYIPHRLDALLKLVDQRVLVIR